MTRLVPVTSSFIFGTGPIRSVDLSDFGVDDFISLACPELPVADLDLTACFIDFTSNPDADFDAGPTVGLCFNDSVTTLSDGDDCEVKIPFDPMLALDTSSITGVRFRIEATDTCTFRCLAIRAISPDWQVAPIDPNTLYGRLQQPVPRDGAASPTVEFPTATSPIVPEDWPILYRSDTPSGIADPRPIDATVYLSFNTGSLDAAADPASSELALYFRELALDEMTQLDLDETPQSELDAAGQQPDFGTALFNNRPQSELNTLPQSVLDSQTQYVLERTQDFLSSAYIEVKLTWNDTASTLTIHDAQGVGHDFDVTLSASTEYALVVKLEDESIRVRIYTVDAQARINWDSIVFDSTTIIDGSFIHRRRGRIGWWAKLLDGDAFVHYLRTSKLGYGEYRSHPFHSTTPVAGAAVYAGASPNRELFTELSLLSPDSSTITVDTVKSSSGRSYKIVTTGAQFPEGIHSNLLAIDNPEDTIVSFNVFDPEPQALHAYLLGPLGSYIDLPLPPMVANRWQPVSVDLEALANRIQPGDYRLIISRNSGPEITTWYLDRISVSSATMRWEVRSEPDDPWQMDKRDWIPVKSTLNTGDGVLFPQEGRAVQLRGQGRTQDCFITDVKVVPKYAELGRFAWRDQIPVPLGDPYNLDIDTTIDGLTVNFSGSALPATATKWIIAYFWTFGDGGFDYGPTPSHTYTEPGTYDVVMLVIDNRNQRSSLTTTVVVS